MPLVLSGTAGVSQVNGTAAAPAITGTDTDTGIFFPAANTLAFSTNGTEDARFDASGNFGLGVTPSAWASNFKANQIGQGAYIAGRTDAVALYMGSNGFWNGSSDRYIANGFATDYYQASGQHIWRTAASGTAGNAITFTQAMTLDASGNLGIGTTSPNARLTAIGATTINGATNVSARFTDNSNSAILISHPASAGGTATLVGISQIGFATSDGTTTTERARIDSSGNLLVGYTTATGVPTQGAGLNTGANASISLGHNGSASGTTFVYFGYNGGLIGSITQNGTTGVLYNLTSDYRLKNNQQPLTGAKEFVMALQPKKWQWWDGSGEGVGFIAHEFMEVAKYSGHGEKDAVDENGNPVYQSIQPSSSEVMANLVALLQEQQAIITQLQADVAALKGNA